MKIAHLILAHNAPKQLERLIKRLSHPDASIYVHLDKKTSVEPFEYLKAYNNVLFIKQRIKVYWGSYNMVEATIAGFKEIIASGQVYDYFNLLSGQDYPIKSTSYIHSYLASNPGRAFMNYLLLESDWMEALPRIQSYHFNSLRIPGRYIFQSIVNKLLPLRKLPNGLIAAGRSQWFTIPPDCVNYLLAYWENNPKFRRFIKLTWAPDEFVFQTILYNSVHKNKMLNNDLRYIDWSNGGVSPKTLTLDDSNVLLSSSGLYARKFDEKIDVGILDFIDDHIKN